MAPPKTNKKPSAPFIGEPPRVATRHPTGHAPAVSREASGGSSATNPPPSLAPSVSRSGSGDSGRESRGRLEPSPAVMGLLQGRLDEARALLSDYRLVSSLGGAEELVGSRRAQLTDSAVRVSDFHHRLSRSLAHLSPSALCPAFAKACEASRSRTPRSRSSSPRYRGSS